LESLHISGIWISSAHSILVARIAISEQITTDPY